MIVYQKIQSAVQAIQTRSTLAPEIGLILGSGLGSVADILTERVIVPYGEIPHFHATSVEGHAGRLVLGKFNGVPMVILQGRFHRYEGYPMEDVVFPTRVVCALGINTLILTNAAGAVNTSYRPCDLMIIDDHINLMGDNPLKGKNISELGPRFPDMSEAYHQPTTKLLHDTAKELHLPVQRGVYAGVLGPTYETPAEIRMLRVMGADAVGMSTVPETIAAAHLGVHVAGVSCITNLAAGITPQKLTHEEVITHSKRSADQLGQLLQAAIPSLVEMNPTRSSPNG